MQKLALVFSLVVNVGCGGRAHVEGPWADAATASTMEGGFVVDGGAALVEPDASTAAGLDASPDVGAPIVCDAGFFIELTDDAGTWRASDNCMDGGPPELHVGLCAEDYACASIGGCGDNRFVTVVTSSEVGVGFWAGEVLYGDDDGGSYSVNASVRVTSFPPVGGTVAGDYVGEAAGAAGGRPPHGTFCVVRVP